MNKKPTLQIMVDTETFSTDLSKGLVLTCALVPFTLDEKEELPEWVAPQMWYIDIDDSIANGRQVDRETMAWWQAPIRRGQYMVMMNTLEKHKKAYMTAWHEIYSQLALLANFYKLRMWSRGIDFDFPLIESSMRDAGIKERMPYLFYEKYDVRTIVKLAEKAGMKSTPQNTMHDAFDDCMKQIKDVRQALRFLHIID